MFNPPGPPRPPGSPSSFVNRDGYVFNRVPGVGIVPATRFGLPIRDTTIGGFPRMAPTIGPPQPARIPGGPPITGPGGQPLYHRAPGPPFSR